MRNALRNRARTLALVVRSMRPRSRAIAAAPTSPVCEFLLRLCRFPCHSIFPLSLLYRKSVRDNAATICEQRGGACDVGLEWARCEKTFCSRTPGMVLSSAKERVASFAGIFRSILLEVGLGLWLRDKHL